ncbi:MAG: HYR domain-containing protein [Pyrinomonadaceae bacterium]|nr:HYR domain-containing protein [Pyrinomonadaceae bacterium]
MNYSATATDNCSNLTVTATHPSGSSFPVGVTTVTVTATDAAGTAATCSFTVTVNAQPDKIAFDTTRDGNLEVYSMNANGSQVTRLTTNASIDESPDWSPDGTKVVFTSNRSNLLDFEIWVMNANGSGQTRLTTSTRSSVQPTWSRDGAQITFATNRLALLNFEIYSMNADGTNQTRLTNNSAVDFNPDR